MVNTSTVLLHSHYFPIFNFALSILALYVCLRSYPLIMLVNYLFKFLECSHKFLSIKLCNSAIIDLDQIFYQILQLSLINCANIFSNGEHIQWVSLTVQMTSIDMRRIFIDDPSSTASYRHSKNNSTSNSRDGTVHRVQSRVLCRKRKNCNS